MRNLIYITALLLSGVLAVQAQGLPEKWTVAEKPEQHVEFRIRNFGLWVNGTFSGVKGDVQFNPARPEAAHVACRLPVNSVNTNIKKRDRHLQEEEYFQATKHPEIFLESRRIESKDGEFWFKGSINIRGVNKSLEFPFSFSVSGQQAVVAAQFTINRRDFNVGPGSGPLGEEVELKVRILLQACT
jgi:polyisoprenoid-binding protein YceI